MLHRKVERGASEATEVTSGAEGHRSLRRVAPKRTGPKSIDVEVGVHEHAGVMSSAKVRRNA